MKKIQSNTIITIIIVMILVGGSIYRNYFNSEYYLAVSIHPEKTFDSLSSPIIQLPIRIVLDSTHINFNGIDEHAIQFERLGNNLILPHRIKEWNELEKKATIWVVVDTLDARDSTKLRMFLQKSGASDPKALPESTRVDIIDELLESSQQKDEFWNRFFNMNFSPETGWIRFHGIQSIRKRKSRQ